MAELNNTIATFGLSATKRGRERKSKCPQTATAESDEPFTGRPGSCRAPRRRISI
jgi:hypothetical protein